MLQTAGASGGALTAYDVLILAANPLSYWRMDAVGSGEVSLGSLGTAISGTGIAFQDPGLLGPATSPNLAYTYPGGGNNVSRDPIQSPGVYPEADEAASLECWAQWSDVFTTRIICEVDDSSLGSSGGHVSLRLDTADLFQVGGNGNIRGTRGNAEIETQNQSYNDGFPHHIVLTGPAGDPPASLKLYVDGVAIGTPAASATIAVNGSKNVNIGNEVNGFFPGTRRFNGTVDEVAVYDFELTPTLVADHFNAGIA